MVRAAVGAQDARRRPTSRSSACLKRNSRAESNAESSRSKTRSRASRSSKGGGVRRVAGPRPGGSTASSQNIRPTTEARCSTARSRGRQRVEAGLEQALAASRGTTRRPTSSSTTRHRGASGTTTPGVDEPGDQLLEVERVALGRVDDQVDERRPAGRRPAGAARGRSVRLSRRDSAPRASRTWWSRPSPHRGPLLQQGGPGRGHDHDRAVAQHPLGVVEPAAARPSSAQCRSSSRMTTGWAAAEPRRSTRPRATVAWSRSALRARSAPPRAAVVGPEVERRARAPTTCAARTRLVAVPAGHGEPGLELLADDVRRVALGDLEPGGDDVAQQRVRAVLARRATPGRGTTRPPAAAPRARRRSRSSSRDLPTPASPMTVDDRASAPRRRRRGTAPGGTAARRSRPTVLVSTPSTPPSWSSRKPRGRSETHEVGVDRLVDALELAARARCAR